MTQTRDPTGRYHQGVPVIPEPPDAIRPTYPLKQYRRYRSNRNHTAADTSDRKRAEKNTHFHAVVKSAASTFTFSTPPPNDDATQDEYPHTRRQTMINTLQNAIARPSPTHARATIPRILAIAATVLTANASAQQSGEQTDAPPKNQVGVELAQKVTAIPGLGLTLSAPEGAYITSRTVAGGKTYALVYPADANKDWRIAIKPHESADKELTNDEALDAAIKQIKLSKPVHASREGQIQPQKVLDGDFKYSRITVQSRQRDLEINGVPAQRAYLTAPSLPNYPDAAVTIFNPSPGKFVMLHLSCPDGTLEAHKPMFEVVSASVSFADESELNARRAASVLATEEIFNSINADDIETHLSDTPRFYRIYKPTPDGSSFSEEDVAWQRTSLRIGQAGEVSPSKPKTRWSAADREYGFLLQIDARALWKDQVVDSQGIFFLSRDRTQERWSIKNTLRTNGREHTSTQTLIRDDEKLNYVVERPGEPRNTGKFRLPPRGYLSKIESAIFPRIIAQRDIPGNYAYYIFDPGLETIVLRHETYEHDDNGGWSSALWPYENAPAQQITYSDEGKTIRRVKADGKIMEPIDPQRLKRIWDRKNLPNED